MNNDDKLLNAMQLSLGLLAHAICAKDGAIPVLLNLMENYQGALKERPEDPAFDKLMIGPLMTLSSLALKQEPNDPVVLELYQAIRGMGQKH